MKQTLLEMRLHTHTHTHTHTPLEHAHKHTHTAHHPVEDGVHSILFPSQQRLHRDQLQRVLGDSDLRTVWNVQERLDQIQRVQPQEVQGQVGRGGLGHP